jgi:hypothetical protein
MWPGDHVLKLGLLLTVVVASIGAAPQDALSRARQFYNQRLYDAAIDAATASLRTPRTADAAALVIARARLERFRESSDAADLAAARRELQQIHPGQLPPRDRVELVIALGEALYLDDRGGAAAEQFEIALGHIDQNAPQTRERVLEWWANALDRQAHLGPELERRALYARILDRMEGELRRDSGSAVASYWLVAGARGSGDLKRAWDAAMAGWARASLTGDRGAELRVDLDRIVSQAIIPERAKLTSAPGSSAQAVAAMRAEWDALKRAWAAP